ncbi:hypothetical protein RHSIM_Rhsim01G0228000 [Rhododendron simsii]|uniref:Uncharacterized protein n=1 Tax=Rhododendron simsii TaxID=118357 RepID=A0A834HG92_RHOSS|nr:hypothetical protein RHSIM_Rhsim01G0228000 [Rhododendron simsii]
MKSSIYLDFGDPNLPIGRCNHHLSDSYGSPRTRMKLVVEELEQLQDSKETDRKCMRLADQAVGQSLADEAQVMEKPKLLIPDHLLPHSSLNESQESFAAELLFFLVSFNDNAGC